jgi:hypothetical protein
MLGDPEAWGSTPVYDSLALCVLDAVVGCLYDQRVALRSVAAYRSLRASEAGDADLDTPGVFSRVIADMDTTDAFASALSLPAGSSSPSPAYVKDVLRGAADLLEHWGLDSARALADLAPHELAVIRNGWIALPGQPAGLSWMYFTLLAGLPGVRPDDLAHRLFSCIRGESATFSISAEEALHLLVQAIAQRLL